MARYRVFYLRDSQVQRFRNAPPKEKPYHLRIKDYEQGDSVEAPTPYVAWKRLQKEDLESGRARGFGVGDSLETEESVLFVLNFWGFDEARWRAPEESTQAGELQSSAATEATVTEESVETVTR